MKRKRRKAPWYHRISPMTWVLLWLLVAASASLAVRTALHSSSAHSRPVQAQVLNGSGVPDLARSVAERLRDRGIDVVSVGNADRDTYQNTLVLLRRGNMSVAHQVTARLGQGTTIEQLDPTLLVDVTVILGRDYVPLERARSAATAP